MGIFNVYYMPTNFLQLIVNYFLINYSRFFYITT
jgi:hypothetical protein